jgi:hypothetical protein
MARPWRWAHTASGQMHATVSTEWVDGELVDTVCERQVATSPAPDHGEHGDPCLACLQRLCEIARVPA